MRCKRCGGTGLMRSIYGKKPCTDCSSVHVSVADSGSDILDSAMDIMDSFDSGSDSCSDFGGGDSGDSCSSD
jgi:hypothetical protein